jgi:hypothetical protein
MADRGPSRPRKRPASLAELPFPRHPAVRWFNPRMLLSTAKFVAISAVFGAYADKREVQATASTPTFHDHSEGKEMWVDYVSDIGDGFDATYTLAYLLAQQKLDVDRDEAGQSQSLTTPRGTLLVMGGDEVYPTASTQAYEEKTKGPYNAALPHADEPPALFAVPGNHDWYDGLTAFLRFFCQGGWVGGWRTEQRRSYFAVKLPQRWWLLGIDIQFDTYIDAPQIDYFRAVAKEIKDGDGIVLCTAKPSWVEGGRADSKAYATLDYFISVVLGKSPDQVRLMLAGDAHHYARYTEIDGERSLVTCGGGGAYLSATSRDDDPLVLPPETLQADRVDPPPGAKFAWRAAYPTPEASRRMAVRVLDRLPSRNPGFVALMIAAQVLLSYVFVASTRRSQGGSLAFFWEQMEPSWSALAAFRQPLLLLLTVVVVWGASQFYRRGKARGKLGGALHGLAHLAVAVCAVWAAAQLPVPDSWPNWASFWSRLAVAGLLGGAAATLLVGVYLYLASRAGIHMNEVFSAQSIEDYKSFLRMHIRSDGSLVMHPLAVPSVCHKWHVSPSDADGDPWLEPDEPIEVRLIEPPLTIRREVPG